MSGAVQAVVAACLVMALGYFGVTQALGAHPFWAFKVTWIGAPIAAFLAPLFAGLGFRRPALLVALVVLVGSALAAYMGKAEFAASFAENTRAGQAWYFGWIGASAGAVGVLALLPLRRT